MFCHSRADLNAYIMIMYFDVKYIYDKDHMSELRMENRSEGDLRSRAVTNKAQKKFWGSDGIPLEPQNFFLALFVTA